MVADADGNSSAIDQTIQSDQQPATPHLSISKDRSGLPRGDVFYFADTGQLDERLDGRRPCTHPKSAGADADGSSEIVTHRTPAPQTHAQQTPDASFWKNQDNAGKDAVMAKEFAS